MEVRSERILVVDDEPALLAVMEQYLRKLGHEVTACRDGEEAWRVFERDPNSFGLVLADMTIPSIPGPELLSRMLTVNPGLRALICSGYPFDLGTLHSPYPERLGFLQKPFTPRMLSEAVEALLAVNHDGAQGA